ncbi:MAG: hypothetical protein AMXMBFR36_12610 [Acidobacteriota bacterium]
MKLVSGLPSGVAAFFFEPARRLRALENELMEELAAAGYSEAILPVIDDFAPYEPLLPPEARAEIHRFAGRDGELLALRSDFTPLVARLLAPHLPALELPLAVSYRGEVVRADRRDGRRPADLHQVGGELLGAAADGARLERAAARAFARLVERASAGRGRIVLGLAGALDELVVAAAGAARAPELARAVARRERAAARGAGSALGEIVERGVPLERSALGARGAAELARVEALAAELAAERPGLAVAVDLAEFADYNALGGAREPRDLRPYYDGLVMRAYLPGHPSAAAGGGRYDRLFRALGAEVAAVGFSLALEPFAAEGAR